MSGERAQYMLASPPPRKQRTSRFSLHHPWDQAPRSANGAPSRHGFLLHLSPPGPVRQSSSLQLLSIMGVVKEHNPCTNTSDRGRHPGPASVIMSIAQVHSLGSAPGTQKASLTCPLASSRSRPLSNFCSRWFLQAALCNSRGPINHS